MSPSLRPTIRYAHDAPIEQLQIPDQVLRFADAAVMTAAVIPRENRCLAEQVRSLKMRNVVSEREDKRGARKEEKRKLMVGGTSRALQGSI